MKQPKVVTIKNPVVEFLLSNGFAREGHGHYFNELCEIKIDEVTAEIKLIVPIEEIEKYLNGYTMIKRDLNEY